MTRPVLSDADRADGFRGLAHPVRRRVVLMLDKTECSAGELRKALGLTPQNLSQHLRVLRDTGLVRHRVEGRRRIYRVNATALHKVQRWHQQLA